MSDIQISMAHNLSTEDLLDRVMRLVTELNNTSMPMKAEWTSDYSAIRFEVVARAGRGTTGVLKLSRSSVTIELKLPFILKPMQGSIKKEVEGDMRKAIKDGV